MVRRLLVLLAVFTLLAVAVFPASANMEKSLDDTLCDILKAIGYALGTVGPMLVALMFLYGGVKYVSSADDPGGRKQGKTICIHAVIGGIIIALAHTLVTMVVNVPCDFYS